MASGCDVEDKTPLKYSRRCQLHRWGQELLDKSEAGLAASDRFSETLICYARERINQVTKGLKLNSSKRTRI